jgi:hypothetical protein
MAAAAGCGLVAYGAVRLVDEHDLDSRQFLSGYCTECHNTIDWEGGIAFDLRGADTQVLTMDGDEVPAEIWEKAVRKVRAGLMPPAGARRPDAATLDEFAFELEAQLDSQVHPARSTEPLSRLNRAEYANAIRDLLAFSAPSIVSSLPADQSSGGFDNISDALSVSPTLIEGYVSAAMTISRQAVGDRLIGATQIVYNAPSDLSQERHIDGLPLGTRGGMRFEHNFPLDGVYEISVEVERSERNTIQVACNQDVAVTLDGEPIEVTDPSHVRLPVAAGTRTVGVALIDKERCVGVNDLYDEFRVGGAVQRAQIDGPFDVTGVGETPARRAIFSCYPQAAAEESPCAREIMTTLATRAYRRPVASDSPEIDTLVEFYEQGRLDADFETGIQHALSRLLVSPQFVFQFEQEPHDVAPGEAFSVSDLELASRLSFFLWSSIPDEELIEVASEGRLSKPGVLNEQVLRMLRDPRSDALVENFAGQWLNLRELRDALPQDRAFDANLRTAMQLETEMVVSSIIDEDRSVLDLLDTDYTFVNDRLAEHYGIAGIRGSYMRRVQLPETSPRRGLLGKGSLLTATSVADRTSPVIRGEWIVTHLLGAPVPEPPPGDEADLSAEAPIAREDDTLRERLERHRANPTCASCHQIMDPLGLALENFDLVGRWRTADNGKPVDASAALTDGTPINGPADVRRALLARSDVFVTALTEQLLTYALGRAVDYRDMSAVREIARSAKDDDYRFSSIVLGITASKPFLMRVKESKGSAHLGEIQSAVEPSIAVFGD